MARVDGEPVGNTIGERSGTGQVELLTQPHEINEHRYRTFRSCKFCRQSKVRCSGERPACLRCRSRRAECLYDAKETPQWLSKAQMPSQLSTSSSSWSSPPALHTFSSPRLGGSNASNSLRAPGERRNGELAARNQPLVAAAADPPNSNVTGSILPVMEQRDDCGDASLEPGGCIGSASSLPHHMNW